MNTPNQFDLRSSPTRRWFGGRPQRRSPRAPRVVVQHGVLAIVTVLSSATSALADWSPRKYHLGGPHALDVQETGTVTIPSPSTFAPIVGIGVRGLFSVVGGAIGDAVV